MTKQKVTAVIDVTILEKLEKRGEITISSGKIQGLDAVIEKYAKRCFGGGKNF